MKSRHSKAKGGGTVGGGCNDKGSGGGLRAAPKPEAAEAAGGVLAALAAPVPAAPVEFFRSCWAACLIKELYDEIPRLPRQYGSGQFNFKYQLAPVPTPSLEVIEAIFAVMFLAAGGSATAALLPPPRVTLHAC